MNELEKIKEKIRTINPDFTEDLLDLLYEYFTKRLSICIENIIDIH